ncbi:TrmH family RNA methyltransferase [Bogoriella caseilytica]|uniref:TrmH family RNA methyltransferase n=1 Tax=Bogoriella caseilytica TaxID=56055 RepID=A0A3N2BG52_9MICO|nr:RNA methyltransferase [Bogoriella caseilytica]ROR74200.1 TrmH family RNA methyltransferase [Bogoriella caseilytica]
MLTNPRADRVRRVAGLSGRSARARQGRYLVEGPQAVREAVQYAASSVRDVYLTEGAANRYPEIPQAADESGLYVHLASPEVLRAMSPDAQEILAVAEIPQHRGLEALAELPSRPPRLLAICAEVTDPGNAGTLIRAADAAGADAVVFCNGSVDVTNPKVVRAGAGSSFHLPVLTGVTLSAAIAAVHERGLQVLAADGQGDHDLDELLDAAAAQGSAPALVGSVADEVAMLETAGPALTAPTAWLFGHEARGLNAEQLALADAAIRIPIHGQAESLNLATAAALCLYASARAQR